MVYTFNMEKNLTMDKKIILRNIIVPPIELFSKQTLTILKSFKFSSCKIINYSWR